MVKKILMTLLALAALVGAMVGALVYSGHWQEVSESLVKIVKGEKALKTLVTYYQWQKPSGEQVVSAEPPPAGVKFVSFQASSDLLSYQHKSAQDIDQKQQVYQALPNLKGDEQSSKTVTPSEGSVAASLRAPIDKTRRCLDLAQQIAAASREGKPATELRARQAKEC